MIVPYASDDAPDNNGDGPTLAQYDAINVSRLSSSPNTLHFIVELSTPFTVGNVEPIIELTIETVGAMASVRSGGDSCANIYPLPPQISVTISEP